MAAKVLIVDDEAHIVQVIAIKLKNNGFEVLTADNGQTAYQLACQQKPDLVITDFQMPAMNGLELIEKLRANPATSAAPVILLTARSFQLEEDCLSQMQVAACLSKPFSPREVLATAQEVLNRQPAAAK